MRIARIGIASLALMTSVPAFAEHAGSMDDQIACTPDVYRLCAAQIPNEDAIVACLQRNKPVLSAACQKVFSDPPAKGTGAQNEDE